MIKYNASDIVKRARQLADLENSDFITWNEDINLLNEQYVAMFQKLINTGDKSFVRSFRTEDREFLLPSDFWQLKGCYIYNNGNLIPLLRRAENQSLNSNYYDIENGTMKINGYPSGSVLVEYFRQPAALTFPAKDKVLDLPETYTGGYEITWKALKGKFAIGLYSNNTNTFLCSYNTEKETFKNPLQLGTYTQIFFTKKYVILQNTSSDVVIWDYRLGYTYTSTDFPYVLLFSESDDVYVYSADTQDVSTVIVGFNYASGLGTFTLGMTVATLDSFTGNAGFCNKYLSDIYSYDYTSGNCYHNSEQIEDAFFTCNSFYKDSGLYYFSSNGLIHVDSDGTELVSDEYADSINGFIGFDDDTGYGYFVNDVINEEQKVVSFCPDTELDFPNSFYFNILAYYMAIAYKSKQGGDVTLLNAQLTQQLETFSETLGDDDFQSMRMTNVY